MGSDERRAQEVTATLERLRISRVHRCSLGLDVRAVHVFVPAVDMLKLTTFDVFGTCADFARFVPVEVRHLTADHELGQRLGTAGHDMFQANDGVSGGADGKMEHSFLEELAFRDRRALHKSCDR